MRHIPNTAFIKAQEQRLARINSHINANFRLYGKVAVALRKEQLKLQAALNRFHALARKKLIERSRQVWSYIDQRAEALKASNYIAYLRIHRPAVYDWAIPSTEMVLD